MNEKNRKFGVLEYLTSTFYTSISLVPMTVTSAFLTMYLTDVVGLGAGIIGSIMLALRFTDGISDIIVGNLIDRTHSKWGKAKPWLVVGGIGTAVVLYMLFNVPSGFSTTASLIYFSVVYFFYITVFGTMTAIAQYAIIPMLTDDSSTRVRIGTFSMIGASITCYVATDAAQKIMNSLGYSQNGYRVTALVIAVSTFVFTLLVAWRFHEKTIKKSKNTEELVESNVQEVGMIEGLKMICKNKYFLYATAAGLCINIAYGLSAGSALYFFRDWMGDINIYSTKMLVSTITGGLLFIPCAYFISQKIGKYKTLAFGGAFSATGYIVMAIGGFMRNVPILLAGQVIAGVGDGAFGACFQAMNADVCDISLWQHKRHLEGTVSSAFSLGFKIGLAGASSAALWFLGLAGYDGMAQVQTSTALNAEMVLNTVLPAVFVCLEFVFLLLCNTEKKMVEIAPELEQLKTDME